MISVVYCTRDENKSHYEHLLKACGNPKVEVIEYVNKGESLTKFYNKALNETKHEIVVFVHDDVVIETKQLANKIERIFSKNPEYGIVGVAGTKYLSESGRWWEETKSMYGRVTHTHEGKTWLSEYSPNQDKRVEETVIVDGVFFAVHKGRLKKQFDESVEGFHFYDVDFCFQNHLEGVKVGVTTEIKVNHMSIGMTNEQWETNRVKFSEKYKDNLPVRIDETFEHRRLKVLIGCLSFQGLTGSELLTLETAKGLSQKNCDVSIVSSIVSSEFKKICDKYNIKTYTLNEPPHYKVGDGNWFINTPDGPKPSQPNMLYRVNQERFDIIHANHTPVTERLLQLYPESNFVNTIGSEIIDLENPVISDNIKKYIAVRPSIKDYLINNFNIQPDNIKIIYNPINNDTFKPMTLPSGTDKKVTLFVGTMDYLREKSIMDLVQKCRDENKELWLVGKDSNGYASRLPLFEEHVKYFEPTEKIEEFYYKCDETAGIMLGRTTIEGFLCGKPGIIYNVNNKGDIIDIEYHEVPKDLSIFNYYNIINDIKNVYIESYNYTPIKPKINTAKKNLTILIPTYNNTAYIEECLNSIESQTYFDNYDDYEILIGVDGCDNTLTKLLSIREKYRNLKIVNMCENMGAYVTMNTLIPLSKYDNLIIFGSDDIMKPEMIKSIIDVSDDFDIIRYKYITFVNDNINEVINDGDNYAMGGIFIKKSVFDLCGGFESERFSCDFELLTRVSKFTKSYNLDKKLVYYRKHHKNLTHTVPISERIIFDTKIRTTNYTNDNVKIIPKTNKIKEIYE